MRGKTISVLGCGWLGLPLAQKLIDLGYKVKGSTTTPSKVKLLEDAGIEPFLLSFPKNSSKTDLHKFLSSDILIFNLPPSKSASGTGPYEQLVETILAVAPDTLAQILFVSSTSVYPDFNREVLETDAIPAPQASSLMLRCEYLVQQDRPKSTIIRFGGLMGNSRHPGRFLAGKKNVINPEAPVNMIHLTDCIGLITEIVQQEKWGFVFNACAPVHPTKREFYTKAAELLNLEPPVFTEETNTTFKIISSQLIQEEMNYTFQFPDPLTCLYDPAF